MEYWKPSSWEFDFFVLSEAASSFLLFFYVNSVFYFFFYPFLSGSSWLYVHYWLREGKEEKPGYRILQNADSQVKNLALNLAVQKTYSWFSSEHQAVLKYLA